MITVSEHRLPSGLRAILVHHPGVHSLSLSLYFAGGSVDEDDRSSGLTHVLEHMLFKGTKRFPTARSLQRAADAIGGGFNASTGREWMEVYVSCHPSTYRRGLTILTEAVYAPLFRAGDLERERRVVVEELRSRRDDHGTAFGEFAASTLYPGLPEGRSVGGPIENVERFSITQVRDRYREVCRTDQQLFVAAGSFDPQQMLAELASQTRQLRLTPTRPRVARALPTAPMYGALERATVQQATLELSFRTFTSDDARWPRLWVLTRILSQRLFHRVRERHALVYGIGCGRGGLRHQGTVEIGCQFDPRNLTPLLQDVSAELALIRSRPVQAVELRNAINLAIYDLDYGKDRPVSLSEEYAWQRIGSPTAKLRTPEESSRIISGTTTGELTELARRILTPSNASCVTMAAQPIDARAVVRRLRFGR